MIGANFENITKRLQDLGLSPYEAKTYLALIRGGELTAIQISEFSGVPKTRIYDILITLERKGFCKSYPGKTTKYIAVEPRFALAGFVENTKQNFLNLIREREKISDELITTLTSVSKLNTGGVPLEYIWVIKDHYQIAKSYSESVRLAEKKVVSMEKAPYAPQELQYEAISAALKRNIQVRSIYQLDSQSLTPKTIPLIRRIWREGAEIRFLNTVPSKFAMFDDKEVWFALQDPLSFRGGFVAVVIKHPSAVEPFKILFNKLWEEAFLPKDKTVRRKLERWCK